jgi:ABC-2 type transport system permease protein
MIGGAVLATAPALWFAGRGLITGYPTGGTWALVLGIGIGLVVLVAGVALGARVFSRRAPELLAFALRS